LLRIAVASSDGKTIDEHFGRAKFFRVFEVEDSGDFRLIEERHIPLSRSGSANAGHPADAAIEQLTDVDAVFANRIGPGAAFRLEERGIRAFVLAGPVDRALSACGRRYKLMRGKPQGTQDRQGILEKSSPPLGLEKHPCVSGRAHYAFGRIHLPVSPACNIQCRYCKRGFNKWEASPGVSHELLTPVEGVERIASALMACPEITVVGIAGPGEPLATDHALETLRRVHRRFPHLIMCLATNGLMLYEKAEELVGAGVRSLTVTVNAVDAKLQKRICSHLVLRGAIVTGEEGARRLIEAQLSGIRRIVEHGVFVKINSVLVPGINDRHVREIASAARGAGASMMNIIPLLPRFEFLSHRPPSPEELAKAQREAGEILPVFRLCRRCRADASGIPGASAERGRMARQCTDGTFSHG